MAVIVSLEFSNKTRDYNKWLLLSSFSLSAISVYRERYLFGIVASERLII